MRRTNPGAPARLAMAIGLALLAVWSFASTPAQAAPYAALVMDARTGEVVYAENADTRLHPASLTKMMTLYLAIEAVKEGRLSLDQKVKVSALAARQPPSRIGLRTGERVSVRNLMRAAAVKSANDAATALAEATMGGGLDQAQHPGQAHGKEGGGGRFRSGGTRLRGPAQPGRA